MRVRAWFCVKDWVVEYWFLYKTWLGNNNFFVIYYNNLLSLGCIYMFVLFLYYFEQRTILIAILENVGKVKLFTFLLYLVILVLVILGFSCSSDKMQKITQGYLYIVPFICWILTELCICPNLWCINIILFITQIIWLIVFFLNFSSLFDCI